MGVRTSQTFALLARVGGVAALVSNEMELVDELEIFWRNSPQVMFRGQRKKSHSRREDK